MRLRFVYGLILGLLGGCRSEKAVFQFRTAQALTAQIDSAAFRHPTAPPRLSTNAAGIDTSAPGLRRAVIAKRATLRSIGSQLPGGATGPLQASRLVAFVSAKSELTQQSTTHRRKLTARPTRLFPGGRGPSDGVINTFFICLLGGVVALLAALFFQSLIVALLGLVMLGIALYIFWEWPYLG